VTSIDIWFEIVPAQMKVGSLLAGNNYSNRYHYHNQLDKLRWCSVPVTKYISVPSPLLSAIPGFIAHNQGH